MIVLQDSLCDVGFCVAPANAIVRDPWTLQTLLACDWHRVELREIARHVAVHGLRVVIDASHNVAVNS